MNFSKIIETINSIVKIDEKDLEKLFQVFEMKTLKKNDHFLKDGQICTSIAYVNSGLLLYYKLLEDGNEIALDFGFENDFVTDNQSRINNLPSIMNIKAIENSEILILSNENLSKLFGQVPEIETLYRMLLEQSYMKLVKHTMDLQVLSAKDRYLSLINKHPEILQKVPLYHISNYLGIAPKSLSRIRNEIANSASNKKLNNKTKK